MGRIPRRPGAWVAAITGVGRDFCTGPTSRNSFRKLTGDLPQPDGWNKLDAIHAPLAVFATKQSAVEGLSLDLESAYDNETRHSDRIFEPEDAKEGPRLRREAPPALVGR